MFPPGPYHQGARAFHVPLNIVWMTLAPPLCTRLLDLLRHTHELFRRNWNKRNIDIYTMYAHTAYGGCARRASGNIKDELCNRNDTRRHEAETRLKLLWPLIMLNSRILGFIWRGKAYFVNIDTINGTITLIYQESGNVTWRRRTQNKYPNMVKLEQNPGYSARPPVVIWRSLPVTKSAQLPCRQRSKRGLPNEGAHFWRQIKSLNTQNVSYFSLFTSLKEPRHC